MSSLLGACNDFEGTGGDPWDLSADSGGTVSDEMPESGDTDRLGDDGEDGDAPPVDPNKVDLLWVIDNSGSMCEEQASLRQNFRRFIETLRATSMDFHFAVTTPTYNAPFGVVAEGGHIQSTPHPLVGFDDACRVDAANADRYEPLRRQIEAAVACAKNPGQFDHLLELEDAHFRCALDGMDAADACRAVGWEPDEAGVHRLFPCGERHDGRCRTVDQLKSVYREIPKVLDTEAYRGGDGSLDVDRLQDDFACMSYVGTRGDSMEQGLRAAVDAVSPEMTGGPVEEPEDPSAPNHGFIRQTARTAVMFVTDENDCSHPDDVDLADEYGCGEMGCYFPTHHESDDDDPLYATGELAQQFISNLLTSKGVSELHAEDIFIGSLHGSYHRYTGEVVRQCGTRTSELREQAHVCRTDLGSATSGDRYEDFLNFFTYTFPASPDDGDHRRGWMCQGDLGTALERFADRLRETP